MSKTERKNLTDLFTVSRMPRINTRDQIPGDIPIITNSKNIPAGYIGNDVPVVPGDVIALGKFGDAHYIAFPFTASDVMVLQTPDGEKLGPEFGLYIVAQLNALYEYANYADSVTLAKLAETKVEVPITEKGEIDYQAVRDKMRPIMEKARTHVDKLVKQYERYKKEKK